MKIKVYFAWTWIFLHVLNSISLFCIWCIHYYSIDVHVLCDMSGIKKKSWRIKWPMIEQMFCRIICQTYKKQNFPQRPNLPWLGIRTPTITRYLVYVALPFHALWHQQSPGIWINLLFYFTSTNNHSVFGLTCSSTLRPMTPTFTRCLD